MINIYIYIYIYIDLLVKEFCIHMDEVVCL